MVLHSEDDPHEEAKPNVPFAMSTNTALWENMKGFFLWLAYGSDWFIFRQGMKSSTEVNFPNKEASYQEKSIYLITECWYLEYYLLHGTVTL